MSQGAPKKIKYDRTANVTSSDLALELALGFGVMAKDVMSDDALFAKVATHARFVPAVTEFCALVSRHWPSLKPGTHACIKKLIGNELSLSSTSLLAVVKGLERVRFGTHAHACVLLDNLEFLMDNQILDRLANLSRLVTMLPEAAEDAYLHAILANCAGNTFTLDAMDTISKAPLTSFDTLSADVRAFVASVLACVQGSASDAQDVWENQLAPVLACIQQEKLDDLQATTLVHRHFAFFAEKQWVASTAEAVEVPSRVAEHQYPVMHWLKKATDATQRDNWQPYPMNVAAEVSAALHRGLKTVECVLYSPTGNRITVDVDLRDKSKLQATARSGSMVFPVAVKIEHIRLAVEEIAWKLVPRKLDGARSAVSFAVVCRRERGSALEVYKAIQAQLSGFDLHWALLINNPEQRAVFEQAIVKYASQGYVWKIVPAWHGTRPHGNIAAIMATGLRYADSSRAIGPTNPASVNGRAYGEGIYLSCGGYTAMASYGSSNLSGGFLTLVCTVYDPKKQETAIPSSHGSPVIVCNNHQWLVVHDPALTLVTAFCHYTTAGDQPSTLKPSYLIDLYQRSKVAQSRQLDEAGKEVVLGRTSTHHAIGPLWIPCARAEMLVDSEAEDSDVVEDYGKWMETEGRRYKLWQKKCREACKNNSAVPPAKYVACPTPAGMPKRTKPFAWDAAGAYYDKKFMPPAASRPVQYAPVQPAAMGLALPPLMAAPPSPSWSPTSPCHVYVPGYARPGYNSDSEDSEDSDASD